MKAVVKTEKGPGHVSYIDFPDPQKPGAGELLVEVKAACVCGTDLHIREDKFRNRPPVVLGHEFSGVVLEIGEGVTMFKPGDRVTAEAPARLCNKCMYCRTGNYNHCSNRSGMGWGENGAFAKYVIIEEQMSHKVPDNISFKAGALMEAAACVAHAIEITGIKADDTVVISGPGPNGLLMTQFAKAEGATVIVTGTNADAKRLEMAKQLGADYVINVQEEDAVQKIRDLTGGYGADIVFECAGAQSSIDACFEYVRRMGKYTQMAMFGERKMSIDMDKLVVKEIHMVGSQSQRWTSWDKLIKLLSAGKLQLESLATHEFKMSEWEKAFDCFEKKEGLKVVLYPED
ncbi:L-iditol 2-dehydrogenase [Oscillibacter sp. PC13]|uniref:zinc-dependent alcohol dehydrogenase n=1 Tax=Oscillibacter sp. PC13 TaxID=1855299 RepID=UPI0008DFC71D|nr:zinc-binding dehydrogenase [Oscillibacter sp. PC13]SFP69252.1 L-iditol 2-dehydrogenase [Oscillibacter sp. PC13]